MKTTSKILIGLGSIIFILFSIKSCKDGYSILYTTNYSVTGQFGDYIGGVVGTLFALAGTFLIYLTFNEQSKENKRNAFESLFFQMINLHKENVAELRIRLTENSIIQNREVAENVFFEFIDCYRDVKNFTKNYSLDDCIRNDYKIKLKKIVEKINNEIDLLDLIIIDISYIIVFYGLNTEGISVIKKNFTKKYHVSFFNKLIFYMELKPNFQNKEYSEIWSDARKLETVKLNSLVEELYKFRKQNRKNELSDLALKFQNNLEYEKCFRGRQTYFGHYFRHLFQTYKYLNENEELNDKEKYKYGKMLRAQLSTYEQAILLINSLSTLGMKWEYTPEKYINRNLDSKLITKFQLIKNLPGEQMFGIKYKIFYPHIKFESAE